MKKCKKCGVEKDVSEFQSHFDKRRNSSYRRATCKDCNRERDCASSRAYYHKNREKAKATSRAYHKSHRFEMALLDAKSVARKREHEPCLATVNEIESAFTGRCDICGVPEAELNKKLCMDHDHASGQFRGWLCRNCNSGIGHMKDSEDIIVNALHYLMNPVRNNNQLQ